MSTVTSHPHGTLSWFDLMTPDAEKARAFYGELFGWTFMVGPAETGFYGVARVQDRNAAGIGQMPPNAPFPTTWSVYFATDNVEDTCAKAREAGGQVMMGPMDVMQEGRLAMLVDPTGAVFGIWQAINHKGAGVCDEPGSMTWAEVNTKDSAKCRAFYESVFGIEAKEMPIPQTEYYTLHKGEKTIGGVLTMTAAWGDIPPHWMPYFAVASADESVERLKNLGGKVMHGPFDTAYGRIAVVADPFGAVFSMIQLSEKALSS